MYDVLVSLKTFLEDDRCIYLIPCDNEALESHLKAINEEDFFGETRSEREFLRKSSRLIFGFLRSRGRMLRAMLTSRISNYLMNWMRKPLI